MSVTPTQKNIWIVIPAYNEGTRIAHVIADLHTHGYTNILVVDDGSHDDTASIAREAGAEVLTHIINRGQGAALRTSWSYLDDIHTPDIIVTFDADGQHQASDIQNLIQPILDDQADIVLGSRFLSPKNTLNIPLLRRLMLRGAIIFTNTLSHIHLTDTHNGLRALNRKAYTSINIFHRGMEHASDIIDEITRNKLRYCERPVHITYSDYSLAKGQKTSNFIKIALKVILKKLA
jgi:glycosyltransferase involved in cell wall biosynthesis